MTSQSFAADAAWRARVASLLDADAVDYVVEPRGKRVAEQLHRTITVDIERSLLLVPQRKLNYRFAAAEALWIMLGDDRVAPLAKHNKRMAEFSDDGVRLAGAYGPRLLPQLQYVVEALIADRDTRQAVASIWTPSPQPSKDIPCTLALTFMIRDGRLHAHAFMRSSDVWLGVPYDLFSFSCYATLIAALHNARVGGDKLVELGRLHLTAASSHLYAEHAALAAAVVGAAPVEQPPVRWPRDAALAGNAFGVERWLTRIVDIGIEGAF